MVVTAIGDPFSHLQPGQFWELEVMGEVGGLTHCMRAHTHKLTSQGSGQPLWIDPQLLRAGCPPGFNGPPIASATWNSVLTDVVTAMAACVQPLRSRRWLHLLSETASERQQLLASCRILQRASSHCLDWLRTQLVYQIQSQYFFTTYKLLSIIYLNVKYTTDF